MSRTWLWSIPLLVGGVVMLLLPLYMQMTGLVLLLLGLAVLLCSLRGRGKRLRQWLTIFASVGVIVLMTAMNLITALGQTDWQQAKTAEYGIVLGASVRQDGSPSRIMASRLRAAQAFLEAAPNSRLILSGGQGGDEPMSEAQCMYETLVSWGVDPSRLLLEPESSNTWENLQFSRAILEAQGGTEQPVAVISSEFHLPRARYIAARQGLETCPVAARTDQWFYRVNYTLRETFAFVKAALMGT